MARDLPSGTVTFLFTDVEGSTGLLHELGAEGYADALSEHRRIVREAFAAQAGVEVDTQGDAFFVAFPTAPGALAAAVAATEGLAAGPIRVRMGIHTGTPHLGDEGYVGVDVHRAARIAACGHGGQVLVSASTAALTGTEGLRDLGEHRLKDLSGAERIYQLSDEEFPPLKSLFRTNLPVLATPFLGRERELGEVLDLLGRDDVRLLTLTGPGGTGKTRLGLQSAASASEHYPDGVFWVPLAALRDPELVLEEAAQVLGAKDDPVRFIADKKLLLLLDNFEQVVEAAQPLAQLLSVCPRLQLLVTSREPLRVTGEQEYSVPPLVHEEGVGFFLARARAVNPDFEAEDAVAEICRRLDDLPLALELAAARVKALTATQILERLERRLVLLTAGARDQPERQRTLRATIEWSYDLLTDDEQGLFCGLAVFRGGCTLEAAEEIAAADLDTLQSLVDKSLLRFSEGRYWMLETIREYAAERLERPGEAVALADRHADHFISLGEARRFFGDYAEEGPALYAELDNFRCALDWLGGSGDVERELRLATAAFWCLWTQASLRELHRWLASALERADRADAGLRADALGAAALAATNLGEAEVGRAYARESLALARERDDKRQIEWALRVLSFDEPDLDERRRLLQQCESLLRELGNDDGLGWVTLMRGWTFLDEGSFDSARETFEQAAVLFRGLGRRWEATNAEIAIGYALLAADRPADARPILQGALATAVEIASPALIMNALVPLAADRMKVDVAAATRLLAAVQTIAIETGRELDPRLELRELETNKTWARERLGQRFEAEWEAGSGLRLEEVVALALDEE